MILFARAIQSLPEEGAFRDFAARSPPSRGEIRRRPRSFFFFSGKNAALYLRAFCTRILSGGFLSRRPLSPRVRAILTASPWIKHPLEQPLLCKYPRSVARSSRSRSSPLCGEQVEEKDISVAYARYEPGYPRCCAAILFKTSILRPISTEGRNELCFVCRQNAAFRRSLV